MIISKGKRETFEVACKPLMDWLLANTHPHCTVMVDSHRAELVEGVAAIVRCEAAANVEARDTSADKLG